MMHFDKFNREQVAQAYIEMWAIEVGIEVPTLTNWECGWSVDEAEVATRDCSIWKYLSSQAAGAVNVLC